MAHDDTMDRQLANVRRLILESLSAAHLRPLVNSSSAWLGGGKMLRSRLLLRLAAAAGTPHRASLPAAAAVEMLHAASLLHDDVVDEGTLRRGKAAFWVEHGVKGAVLLGDLIVCRAMALVEAVGQDRLLRLFLHSAVEMCEAEVEQELLSSAATDWDTCVSIARRKTGSLFAFAAAACAGADEHLEAALTEAGYAVGTAYQLADDILDAYGEPDAADKTLGSDAAGAKVTAASALKQCGTDLRSHIGRSLETACSSLAEWPKLRDALTLFVTEDMGPVLDRFLHRLPVEAVR
jgi:heptaprenyl diphosphate synthase